jgi:DNA-binding response OmpR family regulator
VRPVWSAPRTARLKILLVEDHQATSAVMARLLRKLDHTALTAGSLDAALEVAGAADLDLLISGLGLPDGSGLELMSRSRARHAVTGIAPSGFGRDEDIRRSREAGFAGHLTKPVDLRRLEAMIRQVAS